MTWDADQTALERSFTLSADDLQIVLWARGLAPRLERALMLAWMRVERELVSDVKMLPTPVIAYIAQQLEVEPAILADYVSYQQTRTSAAQDIREYLGVKPYTEALGKQLQDMLVDKIAHTGHTAALLQAAQDWLVEEDILRPPGKRCWRLWSMLPAHTEKNGSSRRLLPNSIQANRPGWMRSARPKRVSVS